MTREQAIDVWRRETQEHGGGGPIGALVALGILKLDEPKSATQNFDQLLINLGCPDSLRGGIFHAMQKCGLEIVSK